MSGVHRLGELAYPEVEQLLAGEAKTAALVPAGATEAHGPHLPLLTDSIISEAVAMEAAKLLAQRGYTAVVFPTIHYAVTDWAASFRGTVSLPQDVASGLTLRTLLSAHEMGFGAVALVNSHLEPGNIATLRQVAKDFEAAAGKPLAFADQTRRKNAQALTEEFQSGSCHAGQYETSLVMAIAPQLVKEEVARGLPEHHVALHEKMAEGAKNFADCGLDRAYCGTPAQASAEEGRKTLEALARLTADAVETALS